MREQLAIHDEDIQTLIDRYTLNNGIYQPRVYDISNATTQNMKSVGPRAGKAYGELTKYGLVHVRSDPDKSQYCNAEVMIIGKNNVTTYAHTYNRATGEYDWSEHAGLTYSVPLIPDTYPPRLEPLETLLGKRFREDKDRMIKTYQRVTRAVGAFANLGTQYDALHQTVIMRNPEVPENMAPLHPYAGHFIGPRVNVYDMKRAGVPFHDAVHEALSIAPKMTIENP